MQHMSKFYKRYRSRIETVHPRFRDEKLGKMKKVELIKEVKRLIGLLNAAKTRAKNARAGKCTCRPAKTHRDCQYCGIGYGFGVCGQCHKNGIDGKVIRGTEERKCKLHKISKQIA